MKVVMTEEAQRHLGGEVITRHEPRTVVADLGAQGRAQIVNAVRAAAPAKRMGPGSRP